MNDTQQPLEPRNSPDLSLIAVLVVVAVSIGIEMFGPAVAASVLPMPYGGTFFLP